MIAFHTVMKQIGREKQMPEDGALNSNGQKEEMNSSEAQRLVSPESTFLQRKEMPVLKVILCDANRKSPFALGQMVTDDSGEVIQ